MALPSPATVRKSTRTLLSSERTESGSGSGAGSDGQSRQHHSNQDNNPSPEEIQQAKQILERAERFNANRHRRDQHRGPGLRHHNRTAGMHGLGHGGKNGTRGGKHGNGTRRGDKNPINNNIANNHLPLPPRTTTTTTNNNDHNHEFHPKKEKVIDDGWSIEALEAAIFNYVDGVDIDAIYPPYIKCILKVKENREFYVLLNRTANLIPDWDTMQVMP